MVTEGAKMHIDSIGEDVRLIGLQMQKERDVRGVVERH